jgi:hypothetical protein
VDSRLQRLERWSDGEWVVRPVTGAGATKPYRCPGCDHEIRPGMPHVVAWPADAPGPDGGLEHRRHWHRPCWDARDRRRVKALRTRNAPRYG